MIVFIDPSSFVTWNSSSVCCRSCMLIAFNRSSKHTESLCKHTSVVAVAVVGFFFVSALDQIQFATAVAAKYVSEWAIRRVCARDHSLSRARARLSKWKLTKIEVKRIGIVLCWISLFSRCCFAKRDEEERERKTTHKKQISIAIEQVIENNLRMSGKCMRWVCAPECVYVFMC